MNQLHDSIYSKSNFLDIYWTLNVFEQQQKQQEDQKVNQQLMEINTISREFLDKTQYTEDQVKAYEWIFGKDFISPGELIN